ncbi:SCO family protein [Marinobacter sp.]|uniref:SCO family protein n=1 Tax=Marinobacter sp. TaxID=50741 RepID=UPI002B48FE9A|nr:SCO family protein [Marinobacter sp.]HKK56606.1 SCO family protein [Marinobacter sp.]
MNGSIRLTLAVLLLVVILIFGLVIGRQTFMASSQEPAPAPDLSDLNVYVHDQARPLADFRLADENGNPITPEQFKGHWTFTFVGYTNCPDICPAAMASLSKTDSLLPATLPQPEYWLITADPEHDTPARLRDYLAFFGEHFHGATGELSELRDLARSLNATFVHREVESGILVDHSGHFALINPEGKLIAIFQPPHSPDDVADAFQQIYEWAKENHPRASQSSGP